MRWRMVAAVSEFNDDRRKGGASEFVREPHSGCHSGPFAVILSDQTQPAVRPPNDAGVAGLRVEPKWNHFGQSVI
jgi:hypothetical protein